MSYRPVIPNSLYQHELRQTLTKIELLRVNELKLLCKSMGLSPTGKKSILQDRIKQFLDDKLLSRDQTGSISDVNGLTTIKFLLNELETKRGSLPPYSDVYRALQHAGGITSAIRTQQSGKERNTIKIVRENPYVHTIHFKESPFYKLKKLIPESPQKVLVTNGKSCCTIRFNLSSEDFSLMQQDQRYKLYLFSGMLHPQGFVHHNTPNLEDIQFPSPYELRMNQQVIKDNIKGLKNKRGTSKPANLTPYLDKNNGTNVMELYYACTLNEYLLYLYIVETVSPELLLQQVLRHPKILRAATLHYLRKTQSEEANGGIETTATVMSLSCPISYTRMKYPAKSIRCQHLQCFDALWFLHSQLQIPTWQCPVCQVPVTLERLAICQYVDDILRSCGEEVEQVELFADGSWKPYIEEEEGSDRRGRGKSGLKEESPGLHNHRSGSSADTGDASGNESIVVISLDSDDEDDSDTLSPRGSNHLGGQSDVSGKPCLRPHDRNKQSVLSKNHSKDGVTIKNPFLSGNRSIPSQSSGSSLESPRTSSPLINHTLPFTGSNSNNERGASLLATTEGATSNIVSGGNPVTNPFLTKQTTLSTASSPPPSTSQVREASPSLQTSRLQSPRTTSTSTTTELVGLERPTTENIGTQENIQNPTIGDVTARLPPLPDLPPLGSYSDQLNLMRRRTIKSIESAGSSARPLSGVRSRAISSSPPPASSSSSPSKGPMRSVSGLVMGLQRPIVAPFVPRRSHSNSLPRKRNMSFSSISGDFASINGTTQDK